jgi:hypothetical protein
MVTRAKPHVWMICLAIATFSESLCLAETLREMLQREGIPSDVCRSTDLEIQTTSGATADFEDF